MLVVRNKVRNKGLIVRNKVRNKGLIIRNKVRNKGLIGWRPDMTMETKMINDERRTCVMPSSHV